MKDESQTAESDSSFILHPSSFQTCRLPTPALTGSGSEGVFSAGAGTPGDGFCSTRSLRGVNENAPAVPLGRGGPPGSPSRRRRSLGVGQNRNPVVTRKLMFWISPLSGGTTLPQSQPYWVRRPLNQTHPPIGTSTLRWL